MGNLMDFCEILHTIWVIGTVYEHWELIEVTFKFSDIQQIKHSLGMSANLKDARYY